ncbi:MAG: energy transducer TonB [Gammaproteobacteria bacterium]|nr:energy transducer TonB [Gammaproteobacteria bacterium]
MNAADLIRREKLPSAERFYFALGIAILLHAIVLFVWKIELPKAPLKRSLEVTLVIPTENTSKPDKADVLAQQNQTAAGLQGTSESPRAAELAETDIKPVKVDVKQAEQENLSKQKKPETQEISLKTESINKTQSKQQEETTNTRKKLTPEMLAQQISAVSTELTDLMNRNISTKRVAYVNTINAHKYQAAAYEKTWQDKVQRIGNMNYPEAAQNGRLNGNLELSVGINHDGSLYRVDVLRSSGHKELDDAAINIVKLAAPFARLPNGVREEVDILFIKRRWVFSENRLSSGGN